MTGRRALAGACLPWLILPVALAYVALLTWPQLLFSHEMTHGGFRVCARAPIEETAMRAVLDRAAAKIAAAGLDLGSIEPRLVLADSHRTFALVNPALGKQAFARVYAMLPATNVFINATDIAGDRVRRDAPADNERGLSGVIAHEVTHLIVRERLGFPRNARLPAWKKEGYAEYVAGESTLDHTEGVRRWRANPNDDAAYRYFKYRMMVTYLLDVKGVSSYELLAGDFDVPALEVEVLASLR
jgi:hypothetical protein